MTAAAAELVAYVTVSFMAGLLAGLVVRTLRS